MGNRDPFEPWIRQELWDACTYREALVETAARTQDPRYLSQLILVDGCPASRWPPIRESSAYALRLCDVLAGRQLPRPR